MSLSVVGKLVALGHYPFGQVGTLLDLAAYLEEGRVHPVLGERIEDAIGLPSQQGLVKGDRDPVVVLDVVPA